MTGWPEGTDHPRRAGSPRGGVPKPPAPGGLLGDRGPPGGRASTSPSLLSDAVAPPHPPEAGERREDLWRPRASAATARGTWCSASPQPALRDREGGVWGWRGAAGVLAVLSRDIMGQLSRGPGISHPTDAWRGHRRGDRRTGRTGRAPQTPGSGQPRARPAARQGLLTTSGRGPHPPPTPRVPFQGPGRQGASSQGQPSPALHAAPSCCTRTLQLPRGRQVAAAPTFPL